MASLISASDIAKWRAALAVFGEMDASYLPEYHSAYAQRVDSAVPLLWQFSHDGANFVYPFLLTPVAIDGHATSYFDITSVYGYTGPIASTQDPAFLASAWIAFDDYAAQQNVIAEFIRFSPYNETERFAHPQTQVSTNRSLAVSRLPDTHELLFQSLGAKTRNMLRKAERSGLQGRELKLPDHLPEFRRLYAQTMDRNGAHRFFWYDDAYWDRLLMLGTRLKLYAAIADKQMVAASMAIAHGVCGMYHLGASLPDYARLGAGNLSLFTMSCGLLDSGVRFVNMTGGRTSANDDSLFLFKRSNATGTADFHIGKRVLNVDAYNSLVQEWQRRHGLPPDAQKVIFWRP
jgi:lipid II:glycine glycyltransferase (peptidoglycan interpeptide bridge formation enzyme)